MRPGHRIGTVLPDTPVHPRRPGKACRPLPLLLAIFLAALLLQGCGPATDLEVLIHRHEPGKMCPGATVFQLIPGPILAVEPEGEILWNHQVLAAYFNGLNLGFEALEGGNLLRFSAGTRQIFDPFQGTVLWEDEYMQGHHSLQLLPWGNVIFLHEDLFPVGEDTWIGDEIVEIDSGTLEAVWRWRLRDHLDPLEHNENPVSGDWSHGNTVKYYPDYLFEGEVRPIVLFLARNLNTLFVIDYVTGDILWSLGQHGTFGRVEPPGEPLFMHPHEADMIGPDHFILYDNGVGRTPFVSRVREFVVDPVLGTTDELWTWTDPENRMADKWGGDANRLPNGNTLLTSVMQGRVVEVDPAGEKVWEMQVKRQGPDGEPYHVYKCERVRLEP